MCKGKCEREDALGCVHKDKREIWEREIGKAIRREREEDLFLPIVHAIKREREGRGEMRRRNSGRKEEDERVDEIHPHVCERKRQWLKRREKKKRGKENKKRERTPPSPLICAHGHMYESEGQRCHAERVAVEETYV